jgi:N-acetylglucosaminyldiphosphoundecaprenol N-acetyl-beta-D-mannosaminyltransferase
MGAASPPRYNVLGVGISALTFADARDLLVGVRNTAPAGYVCCATAHGLVEARRDPTLRDLYNASWLTTPDGMPLVWLAPPGTQRVYGPDLMLAVCDAGRRVGLRHYFYGGVEGVAPLLAAKLTQRFPGLAVAGTFTPSFQPFDEAELAGLRAALTRARPDIVWVGLGTPKQELFMGQYSKSLDAGAFVGVGAAFDFHSGRVRQAPKWLRSLGLEWLFRFCAEPRRLAWRYLKTNPLFLFHVAAQLTGLRNYEM